MSKQKKTHQKKNKNKTQPNLKDYKKYLCIYLKQAYSEHILANFICMRI